MSGVFGLLLVLQIFHVLFLMFHDWIPFGSLNDVKAVRAENPGGKLLAATLISTTPYAFGLIASIVFLGRAYPAWLMWYLWISYGLLFYGELNAWWIPYLFHADTKRIARYRAMFGRTHSFLPERNGIQPNSLHCILHAATLAALFTLAAISIR